VDLALMILVRTAPQLNLFGVGLPVKLGLGLVLIALSAPLVFGQAPAVINGIIQAAGAVFGGSRGAF
jgi:flagellar biosynthetic protein FliR